MARDGGEWERALFDVLDDLEAQAESAFAAEREAELADRSRTEYAEVTLAARLMAETGRELTLDVEGVGALTGVVERVGAGWLLLATAASEWIVRHAAVAGVRGVGERAVPEVAWPVTARLRLGSAVRRLADDQRRCLFHLRGGERLEGVPTRVGQDFVEVREPQRLSLVPFAALAAVQSA
ncbi:MAG: hypothetical protein QM572_00610 [Nocardioides sp.]|uniref:hypothetical protein n=1 Tax=Nocardioides sp. TaxID=35761 RepID=UPI0039E71D38